MPDLACSTRGTTAWAREARAGVTGADMAVILGYSEVSPYALYWSKKSTRPGEAAGDRERLEAALRGYTVDLWTREAGDSIAWNEGSLWRSSERPWMLAAPDADVHADRQGYSPDVPVAALACCTWDDNAEDGWDGVVPDVLRIRLLWQMDALGVDRGHAGVLLLPSGEFISSILWHDQWAHDNDAPCRVCEDQETLRGAGLEFSRRLAGELPAPAIDASESTLEALKARWEPRAGAACEVDPVIWQGFRDARKMAAGWKNEANAMEVALRNQAGDATVLTVGGKKVARRVTRKVTGASWVTDTYRVTGGDDDSGN